VIVSEGSAVGLDAPDVECVDLAVAGLPVAGEVVLGDHREALAWLDDDDLCAGGKPGESV